jgi:hypothetical protein
MQFPLGVYSWLGKSYGMAYGAQRYHWVYQAQIRTFNKFHNLSL